MEGILKKVFFTRTESSVNHKTKVENISEGLTNVEYKIKEIATSDAEMKNFLFSLGCYEGENITLISILGGTFVVNIKDARYSIDKNLARAIKI